MKGNYYIMMKSGLSMREDIGYFYPLEMVISKSGA